MTGVTDHEGDRVTLTTTVGDANVVHAGPLTGIVPGAGSGGVLPGVDIPGVPGVDGTRGSGGWLGSSWRAHRDTFAANPFLPPAAQAVLDSSNHPLGVGAGGEVLIGGLEWMGARVLDPTSRSFLSPDPLEPVTGTGWAGNPYSYAGNNPVNLTDPSGLRPITATELEAVRKANAPKWGTALAIVVGVGLCFAGPMGWIAMTAWGAGLGGGASIIDQACAGGPVDPLRVAEDTVIGGAFGLGFYGLGKGVQVLGRTPVGQQVLGSIAKAGGKIPGVQQIANILRPKTPNSGTLDLGFSPKFEPPSTGSLNTLDSVRLPGGSRGYKVLRASDSTERTVFSGHGGIGSGDTGLMVVPEGTTVNFYVEHGGLLDDRIGQMIDVGDRVMPAERVGSGQIIPDYWLYPPDESIVIQGDPNVTSVPVRLSEIIRPDMGDVDWSACRYVFPQ